MEIFQSFIFGLIILFSISIVLLIIPFKNNGNFEERRALIYQGLVMLILCLGIYGYWEWSGNNKKEIEHAVQYVNYLNQVDDGYEVELGYERHYIFRNPYVLIKVNGDDVEALKKAKAYAEHFNSSQFQFSLPIYKIFVQSDSALYHLSANTLSKVEEAPEFHVRKVIPKEADGRLFDEARLGLVKELLNEDVEIKNAYGFILSKDDKLKVIGNGQAKAPESYQHLIKDEVKILYTYQAVEYSITKDEISISSYK